MGSLLEDYKKSQQGGLLNEFKQAKQPEVTEPYTRTPSALEQSIAGSAPQMVTDRPVPTGSPQTERIPVANAGPYTSGDEFQALLQQAKQVGVDNLPEPQKSQVKAAIQGGVVREQDLMGAQIPPAVQDTATALGELAKDFVRSGDPKDVQEYAPTFLEGLDQMLSKSAQMPGAESAGQSLQRFTEAFQLMPDTIPRDNSLEEVGRATKNLVKGAIRLAPELLTGLQQNPYEFVKGFVTFPIHQINVLLQASIGWRLEPGQPVEATAEEVRKAREDVVNNPLGVLMLGMMAVGGAKGLKQSEYATVNLKEYQRIAEQAKAGEKVKDIKEPVTMGAEDVGKPVPEVKPEPLTPEAAAKAEKVVDDSPQKVEYVPETPDDIANVQAARDADVIMTGYQESRTNPKQYINLHDAKTKGDYLVKTTDQIGPKVVEKRAEFAKAAEDARLAEEAAKSTAPVASVQGGGIWESVQANNDLSGTVGIHKPALDAMVKAYGDPQSVIWERPIAIKENGEIIEGFHRATAAKIAGVEPPMTVLTAKEVSGLNATEVDQLAKRKYTKQSTPPSPVKAGKELTKGNSDDVIRDRNRIGRVGGGDTGGLSPDAQRLEIGGNPRSEFINGKDPGLVTQAEYIQAKSGAYLRAARERGQSTISNRAKGGLIGAHKTFVNKLLSEGKPVPPEVLKDYPDLVKKGELVKPEPVNTGFREADIARNLGHKREFIKNVTARIAEGDKDPELVKTWKRQLQEAKAEEADLMKQVEDVKADNLLGAGLSPDQITSGITNRALKEAERRRAASRSEADVSDPAQIEGTIQQPSIRVLHDTKDIGISAGIRTPQGLLGAAPDLPARYGQAAKEAGETILLTETEIMRESGFRAERLQDALKKADKKDWGKNGDKFYDHITDPSRDGELQPSSLEAVQEVRKFLEEDRQEIITIKREKLRKTVSTLEEKAYRQANDLVGKKLDEAQVAEVQALAEEALKEKVPDDWGVENYLPQFHPGSWEILRDGEHVGTAHTPFDAKLKAIEDYASHPELTPESYTIQGRAFRGGDVVRVGRPRFRKIVSDIADAAEGAVSKDEVSQFLAGKIGTKEGKQKFAGFLQKREGFEGFSKDLPRVLGMYNQQFVRWKYLSDMNAKIQPLIDRIKKEERPQTAEYVQGMMDYLWGPPPTKASMLLDNTIAKIPGVRDHVKPMLLDRTTGFIKRRTVDAFLKFSPRFHGMNRLQRFQTTEPLIDLKESIEGRKFYASAEGKAKLKEFGIKFLTGGKTIEGVQPRLGTLPADVSWATTREKMRSLAPETSNQEIVWATFFKKGKMRGMSDVEASNYAILQGNVYSQFLALRSDTPLIMRGPVGSAVLQFKRFPIKDIELGIDQVQSKNMPGVAKWLGTKLLLGGAKALVDPKLVGGGYLAYATYQKLKDEYGETVANGVMYGLPGLVGVDMSYSFQLAAQPNGDNFKEALGNALLPPWASTLEAAGAAYANDKGLEDNPLQRGVNSFIEKVPSLKFINAMRAWAVSLDKGEYEFRTSDGRLKFQADLKDVLLKAGGFRTVEEGVSQLAVDGFTEIAAERNEILDRTTMKLLQVLNGEGELNEELFSETMDWNENRPEVPIAADALMTRLRRRVPADQIPEIERKIKALGKNYYYWWKATEGN